MGLFRQLLGHGDSEPPPMRRVVFVYFDDTTIVVSATNTLKRVHGPRPPFRQFSVDANLTELGQAVLDCMAASDTDISEDVYNKQLRKFFSFMKVRGWKDLEAKWDHIQVLELSEAEFLVYEFQKCRGGGYASDRQPISIAPDCDTVGRQIAASIVLTDPDYYNEGGPSHT